MIFKIPTEAIYHLGDVLDSVAVSKHNGEKTHVRRALFPYVPYSQLTEWSQDKNLDADSQWEHME